jgi:hypothetical protein
MASIASLACEDVAPPAAKQSSKTNVMAVNCLRKKPMLAA